MSSTTGRYISFHQACQLTSIGPPYRFVRPIREFEPDGSLLRREALDTTNDDANEGNNNWVGRDNPDDARLAT